MGSKNRIAKDILKVILKNREQEQWYVEPFVGGCNVIDKVDGNRMALDLSKYLIAMWKGLQDGEVGITRITKEIYDKARIEYNNGTNINFTNFEIGWIGFMASFNGRSFDGGYNGNYTKRDYTSESIKNILPQIPFIKDIYFECTSYDNFCYPDDAIIYCDIPYKGTKQYATSANFNHDKFWQWCREMSNKGHEVFISEYNAPTDFECIWSKEITNSMNTDKTYKPIEKLFKYKSV